MTDQSFKAEAPNLTARPVNTEQFNTTHHRPLEEYASQLLDNDTAWDVAYAQKPEIDAIVRLRQRAKHIPDVIARLPHIAQELVTVEQQIDAILRPMLEAEEPDADYDFHREEFGDLVFRNTNEEFGVAATALRPYIERRRELTYDDDNQVRHFLNQMRRELPGATWDYTQILGYEGLKGELRVTQFDVSEDGLVAELERRVNRLGAWAEILHNQPPNEAFKERFGIETITASILVDLEDEVHKKLSDIAKGEARLEKTLDYLKNSSYLLVDDIADYGYLQEAFGLVTDVHPANEHAYNNHPELGIEKVASYAYDAGSEAAINYVNTLTADVDAATLHGAYIEAVRRAAANMRLTVQLKQVFLEDIRSGRAAQWQLKVTPMLDK